MEATRDEVLSVLLGPHASEERRASA